MRVHPVTLTALLCPPAVYILCLHLDLLDPISISVLEAATLSCSGMLMWLRSRYLASVYLNEREVRKAVFLRRVREDVAATGAAGAGFFEEDAEGAQRAPRTVARVAPVLPAFIACCFFLLSFYSLMVAVLSTVWHARSEPAVL
ncbi:hypothetical protein ABL78_4812 [Leptomonas seymouri]|uniref:Uncharacterized protein n=1 Tax=Leptomonas seymouri TaxID=5684 RepID=A0A0N1PBL5_LEPSE|nr:hypothetical protein ABL78_4812 [Leptomonas seymouri]|eukprot:KPI86120.1 hypothetical protein ABL78_4812 [Leptomonas seymouri]